MYGTYAYDLARRAGDLRADTAPQESADGFARRGTARQMHLHMQVDAVQQRTRDALKDQLPTRSSAKAYLIASSKDVACPSAHAAANVSSPNARRVEATRRSYSLRSSGDRGVSIASLSASAAPHSRTANSG